MFVYESCTNDVLIASSSKGTRTRFQYFPRPIAKMKSFKIVAALFDILVLFFAHSHAANQVNLGNGDVSITWKHLSASQEIEFNVSVKTTGYVALGLTTINSGMQNIDLFVGGVDSSGNSYLKDYFVNGRTTPTEDSQQDYTLLSASEANGFTTVRCKRKLNTQDASKDLQIQPGDKVYFAYATKASDTLQYHDIRGYSPLMHELVPVVQPTTPPPTTAQTNVSTTTPSIAYDKELSFNNGDVLIQWKFDSNTNELFFKLVVNAAGWVGLGISDTNSGMANMDVVVAGVSGGQGYIGDYYSSGQTTPERDSAQNYTLRSAVENGVTTTVEFKRSIDTGDAKDLQIVRGTSYYLAWAFGISNDALSYHASNKGYSAQKIVLVEAPSSSIATTASSTMTTSSTTVTSTMATTSSVTRSSTMATTSSMTISSTMATTSSITRSSTMATTSSMTTSSTMATTSSITRSSTMATTSTMKTPTISTASTMATTTRRTTSVIAPTSSTTRVVTPTAVSTTTSPITDLSFNNGDVLIQWKFDSNTNELFFKLVMKAEGWVGLGISDTNSGMKDMDIVVAGVSGGQGYIGDYYATSTTTPSRDTTQDYQLLNASESGGKTTVEFKRTLNTGDAKDEQIKPGESYYIAWAYHISSDSFSYHSQRGYNARKVVLVAEPGSTTTSRPTSKTTRKVVPITAATMARCSMRLIVLSFFTSLLFEYNSGQ